MKRTGTPIRLQRISHHVFLTIAVVCAACLTMSAHAAGEGTSDGWSASNETSNPFRNAQTTRWTSTGGSNVGDRVTSPTTSPRPSSRPAAVKKQPAPAAVQSPAATKSRWLPPTQTSSAAAPSATQSVPAKAKRARVGSAISQPAPQATVAQEPKQFVPEPEAKELQAPPVRRAADKAPKAEATPAAYKSVVRHPAASGPRSSANQPRPRIAASQKYRSNTGWISPAESSLVMNEEEIPMPYEAQTDGNYVDGPSFESYDEAYGPGGYGPDCPCGPGCPSGPNCDCGSGFPCGSTCDGGYCGDCIGGYCDEGGCGCAVGCGDSCEPSCGYDPSCGAEPSCGCGRNDGTNCCECFDLGLGIHDPEACEEVRFRVPKIQELALYGGVHGFKAPLDRDRDSGNFGFHEGFNAGAKIPLCKFGYQLGYQAVHSQLNGDKDTNIGDPHTQQFWTAGLFKRTRNGWQYGLAYDMLLDERWGTNDFEQVRAEASFVECGVHEIGFSGAVHLNEVNVFDNQQQSAFTTYRSADQYKLFYRLHGRQGGEGRVYVGVTDDSDAIVGADAHLPVQKYWSVQTGFTYLIPDQNSGTAGASQEAWNLGINLVWHWKGHARQCFSNPYRPLFDVADNGSLIVDDRP